MRSIVSAGKTGTSITAFDSVIPFDTASASTFRMCGMVGVGFGTNNSDVTGISIGIYGPGFSVPFLTGIDDFSSVYFEIVISMVGSVMNFNGFYIPARNNEFTAGSASGMCFISDSVSLSLLSEMPINFYARSDTDKPLILFHAQQEIL